MVRLNCAAIVTIAFSLLIKGTHAQDESVCDTGVGITVKSQAELNDKITPECRTITGGGIFIDANYEGIFNLSQITNVSSILTSAEEDASVPGLTYILLDNLKYIWETLRIRGLDDVGTLDLPKLSFADKLDLCGSNVGSPILLGVPELTYTGRLYICGNVATLDFPKLKTIITAEISNFNLTASRGAWSFPMLAEGGDIWIDANLTSISLPSLKTIGTDLTLHLEENPLDIDLPALQTIPGIFEVNGANSMLVPALRNVGSIRVNASRNSDVDFPALTTTSQIELYGLVSNAHFQKLTNLTGNLIVNSTIAVDCAAVSAAFSSASPPKDKRFTCGQNGISLPSSPVPSPGISNSSSPMPTQGNTGKQSSLSRPAKVGLIVGGSLLGLCALSASALLLLRHVKKSRASHGNGKLEATGEVENIRAPVKVVTPVGPVELNGGHTGVKVGNQDYVPVSTELA